MELLQTDMSSEFKRYATFDGIQTPHGIWPLQLAQAGFYRSVSDGNQVICFACGLPLDVRTLTRGSVMDVHRRLSPNCSFVEGSASNQPVPAVDHQAALEWLNQNFCLDSFQDMETDGETQSLSGTRNSVTIPERVGKTNCLPTFSNVFPTFGEATPNLPALPDLSTLELEQLDLSGQHTDLATLTSDFINSFGNATLNPHSQAALQSVNSNPFSYSQPISSFLGGPEEVLVTDGDSLEPEGIFAAPLMTETEISNYTNTQHMPEKVREPGENCNNSQQQKRLTFNDLGIITQRPKREEYATYEKRLKTFKKWLGPQISQSKETIAEAGFYYAGYSDCCRCFYCGGGLKSWEPHDHPWIEHAHWFKDCPFVLANKGKDFVDAVQSLACTNNVISMDDVASEMGRVGVPDSNIEGNDPSLMGEVEEQDLQTIDYADDSDLDQLTAENNELRRPELCKICQDGEVSILYLPCGHLVTCGLCAPTVKDCPICRQTICGQIRIQRPE